MSDSLPLDSATASDVAMIRRERREPSLWQVVRTVFARDLQVLARRRSQWLNPILFFVIVVALFPLGIGPDGDTLSLVGPGVIWVAALLSTMMSLDMLFQADHRDGTLEQLVLSAEPLSLLVLARILAHWVLVGVPLVLISPLLSLFMQLPGSVIPLLMVTLLLGSLALGLIGAIGAALTVGLAQGGTLVALLVLPLFVPVLIFGAGIVYNSIEGLPIGGQLSLLGAITVMGLTLAPWAVAAALRTGVGTD